MADWNELKFKVLASHSGGAFITVCSPIGTFPASSIGGWVGPNGLRDLAAQVKAVQGQAEARGMACFGSQREAQADELGNIETTRD